jgi:hypothetical protein
MTGILARQGLNIDGLSSAIWHESLFVSLLPSGKKGAEVRAGAVAPG